MSKGGYIDQDKVTAERREKKAAKARGAGKNKVEVELRFSLDRIHRLEASIESVSEMFPLLMREGVLYAFYAAKPTQVSREKICQFIDTVPLLCEDCVDEKWIARNWPSLLDTVKLMQPGDIQHWERDVQNPERVWKTTLYVKRLC